MGIIYPADSQLALASFSRDRFSAATELGAVNWAQLIGAKSHGFLQFGFKGIGWRQHFSGLLRTEARAKIDDQREFSSSCWCNAPKINCRIGLCFSVGYSMHMQDCFRW
jgi:hypothetical protein